MEEGLPIVQNIPGCRILRSLESSPQHKPFQIFKRLLYQLIMFAGPSEHLSEKELREGEAKAAVEVQIFTAACLALWFSPHVVEWARKLF